MRLLVVEDDTRMASLLRRGLREDGYAVDISTDGLDAIWRAKETDYAAVVLDLMLPEIDGFEVCRRLRAEGHWMPVLVLTARTSLDDRIRGLDSGADDYLGKPFSFSELSARLRALLRRRGTGRAPVLVAGTLRLDPATHDAWRGEHGLALSAKEFSLLELFLRRTDQVLSRGTILEQVWDFAYDAGSNIVDQYVAYLRRKIDRPFGVEQPSHGLGLAIVAGVAAAHGGRAEAANRPGGGASVALHWPQPEPPTPAEMPALVPTPKGHR